MTVESAPQVTGTRVDWIDGLRGWAILLVVAGHAIQWTNALFESDLAFRLIYSFHMPLFFFISGVVSAKAVRRPFGELLRTKSLGLLVPFLSWGIIMGAVNAPGSRFRLWDVLLTLYRTPDAGLWFLWVLLLVTLAAALGLRLVPRQAPWVGLAAATIVVRLARLPVLGVEMAGWYFPFFAAGLLLSGHLIDRQTPQRRLPTVIVGLAAAAVWLALALGWQHGALAWPAQRWAEAGLGFPRVVDLLYRYLTAAAGIAASVAVFSAIRLPVLPRKAVLYLGTHTLEVYVSHILVLTLVTRLGMTSAVLAGAIALTGSLGLALALKRAPVLRIALYGGRD